MTPSRADPVLVIGNKNYSSWSLRPWLALKAAGIAFSEVHVNLRGPDRLAELERESPTGKVPVLRLGSIAVPESIAICEWAAEQAPHLLPDDVPTRAVCRAAMAEMHAGFADLRRECPMDVVSRYPGHVFGEGALADIARIDRLWTQLRESYGAGGPFLFGRFTLADAMFAPVASRFTTYPAPLGAVSAAYVRAVTDHAGMQAWTRDCEREMAAD